MTRRMEGFKSGPYKREWEELQVLTEKREDVGEI